MTVASNDNSELQGLGRRQGALWAIEVIRAAVRDDTEVAPRCARQVAAYANTMADLGAAGVDPIGRAVFTKAADDEMARRFGLMLQAMSV